MLPMTRPGAGTRRGHSHHRSSVAFGGGGIVGAMGSPAGRNVGVREAKRRAAAAVGLKSAERIGIGKWGGHTSHVYLFL